MNKKIIILLITSMIGATAIAQIKEENDLYLKKMVPEPFLFSVTTLTPTDLSWSLGYSANYGERVTGPFGYNGVSQQFAIQGYLGQQLTICANAALGFPSKNNISSAQQAEIIRDFIGGKKSQGLRLGLGIGVNRDFGNVKSLLSRVTLSYTAQRWKAGGNLLFEKAFSKNSDDIDVITSIGFHYLVLGNLYCGFEALGEDIEGFWDKDEAEGGAKLLVGPSINMTTNNSKISFSVSGGPVIYATRSQFTNPESIREIPSQSGLTLRARVIFNLFQ